MPSLSHVKWEHVPKTSAANSYELLEAVIAAILAEPRRINMVAYLKYVDVKPTDLPACGTQGCIAGWAAILHFRGDEFYHTYFTTGLAAESLMPLDIRWDWQNLTLGGPYSPVYPWPPSREAGSEAYAEAVVANIRKFMGRHEAALKANILPS